MVNVRFPSQSSAIIPILTALISEQCKANGIIANNIDINTVKKKKNYGNMKENFTIWYSLLLLFYIFFRSEIQD